jgi:hypothetical protein
MSTSRRSLLAGGAGLAVVGTVPSLADAHPRRARGGRPGAQRPFPPLVDGPDGIIALPEGFAYTV